MVEDAEDRPLTATEKKELRALLRADQRRQWLISGIKAVSAYVAVLAGGYFAIKAVLAEFFK